MKKSFITGLIIILPVAVTIGIALLVINFLTKPFVGLVSSMLKKSFLMQEGFLHISPEVLIYRGSQILILIGLVIITLIIGFITKNYLAHAIIRLGDAIIHRIPLINKVYKTCQEVVKTIFSGDKNSFKQVVIVPYPNKNTFALGLISSKAPDNIEQALNERDLITVIIPTTPNPTTGFLLIYPKKDITFIDMKPEDAIKFIVSCGVIHPSTSKIKKKPILNT